MCPLGIPTGARVTSLNTQLHPNHLFAADHSTLIKVAQHPYGMGQDPDSEVSYGEIEFGFMICALLDTV